MKKFFTKLFLLTLGIILFCNSSYGTSPINITDNTKIEDALIASAGSTTDITVTLPAGYAAYSTTTGMDLTKSGVPTTIQKLTIIAGSGTVAFNMSTMKIPAASAALRTLIFQNLSMTGTVASHFLNTTAGNLTDLKFLNCSLTDYRGGIVFAASAAANLNITNITFYNCVIRNIVDYGLVNFSTGKGTLTNITMTNSSYYGMNDGIQVAGMLTGGLVDIENCTLDALDQRTNSTGRYVVTAGAANITVKYSILGRIGASQKGFTTSGGTITSSGNYYTTEWTPSANNLSSGLTAYGNTISNLVTTPTTYNLTGPVSSLGDYTIKDATFAGRVSAGNPSCYYPETVYLNSGTSNISLSALNYVEGSGPSGYTTFTISADVPRSVITLTPPAGYEISANGGTNYYDSSSPVTLGTAYTDLSSTTIRVRLKAGLTNASSPYNGNITVTTTNGTSKTVVCSGTVSTASTPTLDTPAKPTSSSVTSRGFRANWTAVTNANKYDLKLTQGATITTISDIAATNYDVSGLTGGTDYTFTIIAKANSGYNPSLESPASDVISTANITLTTSVSSNNGAGTGGTVSASPSQTYYNAIGATVSLTANRAFGYQFVHWVDVNNNNAEISTSNPLNNFAMNTSQNIQAVFQSIATYNFSSTVTGSGSTWGSVTASPAATGGKYETGTSVTLTPVSNLVSSFSQWEDASTSNPRTITVSGDGSYTATFTASPFIVGWDVNATGNIRNSRVADFYYNSSNKGVLNLYETNGTTTSWTNNTVNGKTCARRWTTQADIQTNHLCRYFRVEVSTKGYKTIQIASKIAYDNNMVNTIQKLQFSTDGTNYSDLTTVDFTGKTASTWYTMNATLPTSADNATIIYLKWIGDVTSSLTSGTSVTSEGFYLTDIVVSGTALAPTAVAGDYVATTSGDISTASNWSIAVNSGWGISSTAVSTPAGSNNVVVPAGITMTNSASASVKDMKISGSYTASAALNITGNLTIASDNSGTGTILDNGNISLSGTTSVQQYLTTGRNWYVSSPVSGAYSSVFNAAAASNINKLYWYDETQGSSATLNWPQITDNSTSLAVTKGYVANVDASLLATTNGVTFTGGSLNTGDITTGSNGVPALSYSSSQAKSGFNLVGNPYPSYLNWNTVTKTNLASNTMWYRTKVSGTYYFYTYNSVDGAAGIGISVPADVTNLIPPMQAFWVRAAGSGASLTFHNTDRAHKDVTNNLLRTKAQISSTMQLVRLQVSNGVNSDETVIYTNPNASNSFDDYDSPKMTNANAAIPEIYTTVSNENLVINGMNSIPYDTEIPLGFTTGQAGSNFSIKASQLANFDSGTQLILKDYLDPNNPVIADLSDGSAYTFSSGITSNNTTRFAVIFKAPSVATVINSKSNSNVWISTRNGKIMINGTLGSGAKLEVFNAIGQKVISKNLTKSNVQQNNTLATGAYLVKLTNEGKSVIKKIIID